MPTKLDGNNVKKLAMFIIALLHMSLLNYSIALAQESNPDESSSTTLLSSIPVIGTNGIVPADNASVDLFTGSMNYSIPIRVPVGRRGMAPQLALTYRNSVQNGWLGLGWELEVGYIQRSTKYGVDYGADSFVLRLNGATIDVFNYNGKYQAKIESLFYKIVANKDSAGQIISWEVKDKSGKSYFFGRSSDSRQDDPGDPDRNIAPDSSKIFKWCLDYVVDTNGNYIQFFYFKDQGQIYLDHIDYAGNEQQA